MTVPAQSSDSPGVTRFPDGFVWGAATAAFQIEGATSADGRTDSIWDAFARVPGAIDGGDSGEPGADHYRRMREDVALMAELGLPTYRFSVAWPRIRPDGGAPNPAGLDFYQRLVDTLLDHGIEPWITLYHWDLPQTLEAQGGWPVRDTAYRFAEFAETTAAALGDRVTHWITLNEPFCASFVGYASGEHAPGRREPKAAVAAAHHLLLAHGLAVPVIRAHSPGAQVGISVNPTTISPADPESPADRETARRIDGLRNRLFLDALLLGRYPDDVLADLEPYGLADHVEDGDLAVISTPLDLLGVNYYDDSVVSAPPPVSPSSVVGPVTDETRVNPHGTDADRHTVGVPWVGIEDARFHRRAVPQTAMGWEVRPAGLRDLLVRLHRDFPNLPPLYITENGAAFPDVLGPDGVADVARLEFHRGYLQAAADAIADGVDLRGYFAWSLLDNFEWAWGYDKRFGLVHVDYATQQRTVKASGHWYASVIAANSVS